MNLRSFACLSFLFLTKQVFSQTDIEAEYLKKRTSVEIKIVGGELNILEHNYAEKKFYKNFEKHARESVFFSDFDPIVQLEAVSILPSGARQKKIEVSTIETKDIVQPGVFYGGYKRKDFVFPKLSVGSVGVLEYTKQINDVHLLSPFYFGDDVTVRESEFSLSFSDDVSINFKVFGEGKENITFSEKLLGGNVKKYTWILKNIPADNEEENAPSRSYFAPHIIIYVQSYISKGKNLPVLNDVSDLYKWYSGLIEMIPGCDLKPLQKAVDTITSGVGSDKDKIRLIFQWVQKNVKYVAFENGMAGFIPRASRDVYEKRYGDCKDMANLLRDMLVMAGIPAYHTWIGTRSKPYSYQEVPTAIANNHMICSVKLNGEYIFLDATNSFLSFGKPSSMIQGKEALIGITSDEFNIVKVPIVKATENQRIDTVMLTIENAGIHGHFSSELVGYKKDDIEISHLNAEIRNRSEYIRDFFRIGNNDINMDNIVVAGLGKHDEHAYVNFDFFQPGYYKGIGDKIYINLNFNKSLPGDKIGADRKHIVEQDYQFEEKFVTILEIPPAYEISFLPPNVKASWAEFEISSTYSIKNNTIIVEKIFRSNYLYLERSDFSQWNEMLQALININQQSVTLSKK
jgi:hypothetical protein